MIRLPRKFGQQGNYIIVAENQYHQIVPESVQPIFSYIEDEVEIIPTWHERYLYDNSTTEEAPTKTIQGKQYKIVEVGRLSEFQGQMSIVKALAPDINNVPDYCVVVDKQDLNYALDYYGNQ